MKDDKSRSTDDPFKTRAANDNSVVATGPTHPRILAIARLIGRQIAREEFERRQAEAANDNQPPPKASED
jgi:hypothetical protein